MFSVAGFKVSKGTKEERFFKTGIGHDGDSVCMLKAQIAAGALRR